MKTRLLIMLVALICATGSDSTAVESNLLEIVFDKDSDPSAPYRIFMSANKIGAVTCSLDTPLDTYAFSKEGEEWFPEQRFLDDHENLNFQMLTIIILGNWLLTWDAGQEATETTCLIEFGTLQEDEFPLVPVISIPINGSTITNPDPNSFEIAWDYGGVQPCDAQTDFVAVELQGPGSTVESGEMPCATISWTPMAQLYSGNWTVEVHNVLSSVRDVPDGLWNLGDAWNLDNSDWLSFRGLAVSVSDVVVPTTKMSFGKIKALFR